MASLHLKSRFVTTQLALFLVFMNVMMSMLRRSFTFLKNPKEMILSWIETAARHVVVKYFKQFISAGQLVLVEDGGSVLSFGGSDEKCTWKSTIRVNPQFYIKVATEADLGFADAFINGDISMVDKDEGLLNFFMIILANRYLYPTNSGVIGERVWWKPMLLTAGIASAKYYFRHCSRHNSVSQARQNISQHYDLSNELFSLFMAETMVYSSAIFKYEDEDLNVAQLRKVHLLLEKAKIDNHHELLEIGSGWGTLGVEAVKKTGCKYIGITLSQEQLKFSNQKAKDYGVEDNVTFLLCDYRQLSTTKKYDRIICCEMLEHVGDEYYEDFFRQCDSLLSDDGILVLQVSSMPDQWYERRKKSSDFMTEYIFPGGSVPCFNRLMKAMTTASKFCVEDVESIGMHYYKTLQCWRKNLLDHHSEILSLGFDDKFMRTWEYYFDYCASGFKTRTLTSYQVVLSRPGNLTAFSDPYACIPSARK